jgi:hypothetical protein
MQAIQQESEVVYTKILTKDQKKRLGEIDLQRQGPMAVMRPEVAQKLNIGEDQMAAMQEIQQGQRQQMGELFQARGAQMREMAAQFTNPDGTPDRQAMRDAMQKRAETPEGKAEAEQMRKQTDQVQSNTIKLIGRVLTKKQKAAFEKMQGKPFDLTKLGGPGGPGGPGRNNNQGNATTATPSTDKAATTAKSDASTKKGAAKKTTTKKKAA